MYEIPVRIDSLERQRKSVAIFHVLVGLFLAANAGLLGKNLDNKWLWVLVPIYLISVLSLLFAFRLKKVKNPVKVNQLMRVIQAVAFLISGVIMVNFEHFTSCLVLFIWSGICLVLFFMERSIFSKPTLKITEANLHVPSLFSSKRVNWNTVESVIIRQDFITINYLNNRYLQLEVFGHLTGTEIEHIRLFCNRKTIGLSRQERQES
jgi:hypothetical protein